MPSSVEIAWIAVPMAVYFYVLGLFHGGTQPRVVSGVADLAWLMVGLSGLIASGPLGRVVVTAVFGPTPTVMAWLVWVVALLLGAGWIARTGRHRVVVYHVELDQVRSATRAALADLGWSFATTLQGFEDVQRRTSVSIRGSGWTKTAVIDAQGDEAAPVVTALRLALKAQLRSVPRPVSSLSTIFFVTAGLIMLAPVVGFVAFDPRGQRAVRILTRWLGWR